MSGRGRKTWRECVKDDMDELGLHSEWVVFREEKPHISFHIRLLYKISIIQQL